MHDDESAPPEDDAHDDRGLDSVLGALAAAPRPRLGNTLRAQLPAALRSAISSEAPGNHIGSPPAIGELVDERYRIEGVLGEGGMGIVFSATHLKTQRRVALKWLRYDGSYRSGSEQDARLGRFAREARSVGRIRHPNVIDVFDAGTSSAGPFLVMEHLEGETLRARIDRAAFSWDEALQVILPAMAGVSEAHRCGVIHRDLKPDNVVLAAQADGSVQAKVLDFGISRLSSPEGIQDHDSLTKTGTILGTPAYMPLEQLRAGGDLDARTDVYALGVMLYELLSQQRPFVARNAADYAALIACERPTPLSRHRPDLKGAREQVVMKALERNPQDRYQSVEAFAQALKEAAQGKKGPACVVYAVAACAMLGLAVGAWLLGSQPPPVREAITAAQTPATPPQPAVQNAATIVTAQPPVELEQPHAPTPSLSAAPAGSAPTARQAPHKRARASEARVPRVEPSAPANTHENRAGPSRSLALEATDFSRPSAPGIAAEGSESTEKSAATPPLALDRAHF